MQIVNVIIVEPPRMVEYANSESHRFLATWMVEYENSENHHWQATRDGRI